MKWGSYLDWNNTVESEVNDYRLAGGCVCGTAPCQFNPMQLYHWTLNRTKLKAKGFPPNMDRHSDSELGVWLTDIITGSPESIKSEMRMVTIEIPEEVIIDYEETNTGSGYRAFRVPAEVVNQYELNFPTIFSDRGVFKLIPF